MEINKALKICLDYGIEIVPIYIAETQKIAGKTYRKNNWYIKVNNRGKKTIYPKSIKSGSILRESDTEPIIKTIIYWAKKIQDEINKRNNNK